LRSNPSKIKLLKQKLKNYLKLGILLFGISIVMTNCQKETDFEEVTVLYLNKPKYVVTKINSQKIAQNEKVKSAITDFKNKKSVSKGVDINGRLIEYENFNVVIDDTKAKYLEESDGTYHSWTFKAVDESNP